MAATAGLLLLIAGVAAQATPDYRLLDQVLLQNVRDGYVDYDGIRVDPRFEQFIGQLGEPAPADAQAPEEQLALLINAYNAFAIKGILGGYTPATRFGRYRYFKRVKYRLQGQSVTLEDLEQKHIRPLGEPRIHFAIVCASISCPRLSNRAYVPATLDAQLDQAAERFTNDMTRNRFDVAERAAFLSPIFDWFQPDFAKAAGSVPAYLARYAGDGAVRAALLDGRLEIHYLPYDWDLNGRFTGAAER